MNFNPNDTVQIKPTVFGWDRIMRHVDEVNEIFKKMPKCRARMQPPETDDEGYIEGQFWALMEYFGDCWGIGSMLPFTDIRVSETRRKGHEA